MDIDKLDIDISQHVARALCVILDRKPRPSLDRVALRVAGGGLDGGLAVGGGGLVVVEGLGLRAAGSLA